MIPDFELLLDLVASLSAPSSVFILPCFLFIAKKKQEDATLAQPRVYVAGIVAIFGVSVSVISLYYAIVAVVDYYSA